MKLTEIFKIVSQPSHGINLDMFDYEHEEQVCTAENYPVFKVQGISEDLVMFYIKHDNKNICMIVGSFGTLDGPAFFLTRTFTDISYRRKGFVFSLYKALYDKLHLNVVSDVELTNDSINVWKKLATVMNVEVLFPLKKEILPISEVTDNQLFDASLQCRFVLRHNIVSESMFPQKQQSAILKDYIHFTHSDNDGVFW